MSWSMWLPIATQSDMSRLRTFCRMEYPPRRTERTLQPPTLQSQTVKAVSIEGRVPFGPDLAEFPLSASASLCILLFQQSGDPSIQKIVDFVHGDEGQAIIARYHAPIR